MHKKTTNKVFYNRTEKKKTQRTLEEKCYNTIFEEPLKDIIGKNFYLFFRYVTQYYKTNHYVLSLRWPTAAPSSHTYVSSLKSCGPEATFFK